MAVWFSFSFPSVSFSLFSFSLPSVFSAFLSGFSLLSFFSSSPVGSSFLSTSFGSSFFSKSVSESFFPPSLDPSVVFSGAGCTFFFRPGLLPEAGPVTSSFSSFSLVNMISGVTKSGMTFCQNIGSSTSTSAVAAALSPVNLLLLTFMPCLLSHVAVFAPSTTRVRVRFAKISSISSEQNCFPISSFSSSIRAYAPFFKSCSISFEVGLSLSSS
mmetsp:Transcript_23579/g.36407  ORF Transcript_23579/g.36407 Transcript_23579/m.36407 type:complete len:214 (-) Transcript_23579:1738-2379(-)